MRSLNTKLNIQPVKEGINLDFIKEKQEQINKAKIEYNALEKSNLKKDFHKLFMDDYTLLTFTQTARRFCERLIANYLLLQEKNVELWENNQDLQQQKNVAFRIVDAKA